jgi:hypothetical protein
MHTLSRALLFAIAFLIAGIATAGPFCVVSGAGKQCFYSDEPSCARAAASLHGACVVNNEEVKAPATGAPFCVVSGAGAQCVYYNFQACENAAKAVRGTCAAR